MKVCVVEQEIGKVIATFDKSSIPDDLAKADAFYNYLQKQGILKKKGNQLFPNEAYSFESQSGQIQ